MWNDGLVMGGCIAEPEDSLSPLHTVVRAGFEPSTGTEVKSLRTELEKKKSVASFVWQEYILSAY